MGLKMLNTRMNYFWLALVSCVLVPAGARGATQLSYAAASDKELGLPADVAALSRVVLKSEIPGRRIPELTIFTALSSLDLPVGSSRVDLQACKLEYSIVSPK